MESPADRLLDGLSEPQRSAVTHVEGPLLVLAGPGSGKTRVITHRIAYLIERAGVRDDEILALTFTNKAADEMRTRVRKLLPGHDVFAGTFHRFCVRTLRRLGKQAGLTSDFTILEPDDVTTLIARIMKAKEIDAHVLLPATVHRRISNLKNELVGPEEFASQAVDYSDQKVAEIYPLLVEEAKRQNALDFDDLLFHVAMLLKNDSEIRSRMDRRYRFILVDEYQDTNLAQYAIARGLSVEHPNLCATGDPDQSIYSWRGADVSNILNFDDDFPEARVIRLEENYRSTKHIVAAADSLIQHNIRRKHKDLITRNDEGKMVQVVCHQDEGSEARFVAAAISQGIDAGERSPRDYAVFVRTSTLFRSFEHAFRAQQIPYQVVGGFSFFTRKEVRDLLAYIRLLANPADDSAFERIVNAPPRGIGPTTLDRLRKYARQVGMPMLEACRHADRVPSVKVKQVAALRDVAVLFDEMKPAIHMGAREGLDRIIDATEYRDHVIRRADDEDENPMVHLDGLLSTADELLQGEPSATVLTLMESLSLASDSDVRNDRSDVVTLMTLHAAKGLEFTSVFLAAFEEGLLPHKRAVEERNEEEERRLAFVGMTRAREELCISYTRRRPIGGRIMYASASKFLFEMSPDSLHRLDVVSVEVGDEPGYDECYQPSYEEPSIQIYRKLSEPSPWDRFQIGMAVAHPSYGKGYVCQVEGMGEDRRATIHFPSAGTKSFVLSKSPLTPVGGSQ